MMPKLSLIIALLFVGVVSVIAQGQSATAPGLKKLLIGPVETISTDSVTLTDKKNKTRTQVSVDATKLGAVRIKDLIAVIETDGATAGGKFKVQKIFVKSASDSAQLNRRAVMGIITAINGNVLTIAHQTQTDRTTTVIITPLTIIQWKSQKTKTTAATGAAALEATPSATQPPLAIGQRIVAMGNVTPEGLVAKRLHIIPGIAGGVYKKLLTPKPSTSATPTATPTPSGTPSATLAPTPTATASASPL